MVGLNSAKESHAEALATLEGYRSNFTEQLTQAKQESSLLSSTLNAWRNTSQTEKEQQQLDKWTEKLTVNLNVLNVFDYTQTSAGDSPSTWHWHFNHAHYDGLHTWGPNAGRQFQLALDYKF